MADSLFDTRPVPAKPPDAAFVAVHAVADLLGHGKLAAAEKLLRALLRNGLPGEAELTPAERVALYRALGRLAAKLRTETLRRLQIEAQRLRLAHLARQVRGDGLGGWRVDELSVVLLVCLYCYQLASGQRALPDDLLPLIGPWLPYLSHLPPLLEAPATERAPRPAWVGPRVAVGAPEPE